MQLEVNLHSLTIGSSPLEKQIEAARRYFDGFSLPSKTIEEFVAQTGDVALLQETFSSQNVTVKETGIGPFWQCLPTKEKDAMFHKLEQYLRWAHAFGVAHIVACGTPGDGDFDEAVEDFRTLCQIAAPHGIQVAFEWMGFSPLVGTLDQALKLLDKAGAPNAGLALDVFHFYRGRSSLATLRGLDAKIILAVHLNDVGPGELHTLRDGDREMPGDGVAPLDEILRALAENNWSGPVSLELGIDSRFWRMDPLKVAEEGARKARTAMARFFP